MVNNFEYGTILGQQIAHCDVNIDATFSQLKQLFGEPNLKSGDGKSNYIWGLIYNKSCDEQVSIHIYDWKYYRKIDEDEIITWEIASNSHINAMNIKNIIEKELSK